VEIVAMLATSFKHSLLSVDVDICMWIIYVGMYVGPQ